MWPPCGRIWMWRCPSRRPTCCIVPFIVMSLHDGLDDKVSDFWGKEGERGVWWEMCSETFQTTSLCATVG